jgi:hypothetical protein
VDGLKRLEFLFLQDTLLLPHLIKSRVYLIKSRVYLIKSRVHGCLDLVETGEDGGTMIEGRKVLKSANFSSSSAEGLSSSSEALPSSLDALLKVWQCHIGI